mgnify:CR=1 FL=1
MALSQPAKFGEEWSDDRIRGYLNRLPPAGADADFHVLHTAYKHMRAYDFERFIAFFLEAGRRIDATDEHGKTLLDLLRTHTPAGEFVAILENAQGKSA